jgi:NADH:ubiquinone oxidoreductase subunit 3 (subunit A)
MTPLAAYVLLFLAVGVGFIFVHLVAGKLIRPSKRNPEKDTIYECGEPTIGSAWIQFDLRFYVVALLFVIFDVEVAFFFPWAEVFGKANAIRNAPPPATPEEHAAVAKKVLDLSLPPGTKASAANRRIWERVKTVAEQPKLIEKEVAHLKEVLNKTHTERVAEAKSLVAAVKQMPKDSQDRLRQAIMPSAGVGGPNLKSLPSGPLMFQQWLDARVEQVQTLTDSNTFGEFRSQRAEDLDLVYNPGVLAILRKSLPKELAASQELSRRQAQEIRDAAAPIFAAVKEEQVPIYEGASFDLFDRLSLVGLTDTQNRANNLVWLAFFEILVFFGVLLVGFAYLWRRGDLAWVRSTAAESVEPVAKAG